MGKVLDACYNPDSRNPANAESVSVDINRSGVWREWHKQGDDGQWHGLRLCMGLYVGVSVCGALFACSRLLA